MSPNAQNFVSEADYLSKCLDVFTRMHSEYASVSEIEPPLLITDGSSYGSYVHQHVKSTEERLLIVLAMAVHAYPQVFQMKIRENELLRPVFGFVHGKLYRGIIPTGNTWLHFLAKNDVGKRMDLYEVWSSFHCVQHKVVSVAESYRSEPYFSGMITLEEKALIAFLNNQPLTL